MAFPPKDPDAVKDYSIDWSAWLGSDTISTSEWTVPSGITKDSDSNTTTVTTIWLSGGTAGTDYELVNRIVTAAGRTEDKTVIVRVRETTYAKSYGSISEVEALVGRYTSSGDFTSSTRPTLAQVERFIDRISAIVNVLLAEQGFSVPVTQVDAKLALDEFVVQEAVQLCHAANGAGAFAPGSRELRNQTPFQIITKEAEEFITQHAAGLEALGATRSRHLTYGLACRTVDDAGEDIVPIFSRKQMGNVVVDWEAE